MIFPGSSHSFHPNASIIDASAPENSDIDGAQRIVEYGGNIYAPCADFVVSRHRQSKPDATLVRDVGCILMSIPQGGGLVVSLTPELLRSLGQVMINMASEIEADAAALANAALSKAAGK